MTILDILSSSAELLGLKTQQLKLITYKEENNLEINIDDEIINRLFSLSKLVVQELCSNYIPIVIEENILSVDKCIPLSRFKNLIRIQKVIKDDEIVKYKLINKKIVFESDDRYTVRYTVYPEICSIFDEVDFLSSTSPDVLVFGLCAYYSLTVGQFEEFNYFQEKYEERAKAIKNLKVFDMPKRRWQ